MRFVLLIEYAEKSIKIGMQALSMVGFAIYIITGGINNGEIAR